MNDEYGAELYRNLINAGYTSESVIEYVLHEDRSVLKHTSGLDARLDEEKDR